MKLKALFARTGRAPAQPPRPRACRTTAAAAPAPARPPRRRRPARPRPRSDCKRFRRCAGTLGSIGDLVLHGHRPTKELALERPPPAPGDGRGSPPDTHVILAAARARSHGPEPPATSPGSAASSAGSGDRRLAVIRPAKANAGVTGRGRRTARRTAPERLHGRHEAVRAPPPRDRPAVPGACGPGTVPARLAPDRVRPVLLPSAVGPAGPSSHACGWRDASAIVEGCADVRTVPLCTPFFSASPAHLIASKGGCSTWPSRSQRLARASRSHASSTSSTSPT